MNLQSPDYIDGTFAMELLVNGVDEHGLPMLELTLFPVFASKRSNAPLGVGYAVDFRYIMGERRIPLEETGLSAQELNNMPLCDGWTVISYKGAGLRAEDAAPMFGPRAALVILEGLSEALLSECINEDYDRNPFREGEDLFSHQQEDVSQLVKGIKQSLVDADEASIMQDEFRKIIETSYGNDATRI